MKGLRDEIKGLRDDIKNKDEVDAPGHHENPPKVKGSAHRYVHYNFSYISIFSATREANSSIPLFGYCGFVLKMIL